jgi:hypothetical protein
LFLSDDSTVTAFGSWVVSGQDSITARKCSMEGVLLEFQKSDFEIGWGFAGGNPNMQVSNLTDGYGMSTACVGYVSSDFSSTWALQFDEWSIEDSLRSFPYITLALPGDTILLVSNLIYENDVMVGEDEEPTITRLTRITSDGQVIDSNDHYNGELWYSFEGGYVLPDGNYYLFGYVGIGNDRQMFSIKFNQQAEYMGYVTYGNEDTCWENGHSHCTAAGGKMLGVYLHCIDQQGVMERNIEVHRVVIDPETMTLESNEIIAIPEWTTHSTMANVTDLIPTADGGYLAQIYGQFYESTNYNYKNMYLLKLDSAFEVEWFKDYVPPIEVDDYGFWDVIQTLDGGYMCLGEAQVPFEDGNLQRLWLLKVDACGDIESNGCPPPIGISESQIEILRVFPNPTSNTFTIQSDLAFKSVILKDITGKVILNCDVRSSQTQLDISHLAQGLYMLEVDFGNGKIHARKVLVE